MTESGRKSRKGIELKPATVRKRHNLAFRVNDRLRHRLQESADATQRSVSEELEYRVQLSFDALPIMEEMAADKNTAELFRALAETAKSVRKIAKQRGLSEIETRQALRAAFNHVAEVMFWDGGEMSPAPDGFIGSMDRPPVGVADKPPAAMGYGIATGNMSWSSMFDRCQLMDDFSAEIVANRWSGDGSIVVDADYRQPVELPARSLDDIMAETNPRDRKTTRKS